MELDKARSGYVFNIQKFSVHDGPGIRTIVFLKGCPLRCGWCSNPESQNSQPELAWRSQNCIGCNGCIEVCPEGAISKGADQLIINRDKCQKCFSCARACPSTALHVLGELKRVEEILQEVEADSAFYARSGGGMTLSGGEPLLQSSFAIKLLKEARRRRIHTAIETSGAVSWSVLAEACQYLNSVIYDLKSLDPVKHQEHTGLDNQQILANFAQMCREFPQLPKLVRTPIIPGFNDSPEEISAIMDFIGQFPNVKYELLKYHRLGQPKYHSLGRDYPLAERQLADQLMQQLRLLVKERFADG